MKPIEALIFALVERYALEFVPPHMRDDFDAAVGRAQTALGKDPHLVTWIEQKTVRIDTWQGLLAPPQPENEILDVVSGAIFAGQSLEISYHGEKGVKDYVVSPLAIVKRDEVLYVVLRFSGYEDARLLALHRIDRAAVSQTLPVSNGKPFDLCSFLKDGLPFTPRGEKVFDLHLRFPESVYRSIKGRPLRNMSSISEPEGGWFEVKAKGVFNAMELRWWLLGFGDKVRILEPEFLARELQYLLFDQLTSLALRHFCQEHLDRMIAATRRTGKPLAVALADIDHFKLINDELGHNAGDKVLQEVSRRLKMACRSMDVVGRWGGEEFLILLPETNVEDATRLAERLRQEIASTPCLVDADGASRNVSISIGVTSMGSLPQEASWPTDLALRLLDEADKALYKAKEMRDRVEVSSFEGFSAEYLCPMDEAAIKR